MQRNRIGSDAWPAERVLLSPVVAGLGGGAKSNVEIVRVATTGNHGLSGLSAIDGVTPSAGDRVLVWQQSTASQNGIYTAASSSWTKKSGFTSASPVLVCVQEGTTQGLTEFLVTATNTVAGVGAYYK